MIVRTAFLRLFVLCYLLLVARAGAVDEVYNNPLVYQRADPHITHHTDGYYYLAATVPDYDRIELRRARDLNSLGLSSAQVIWKKHPAGPMGAHIWAPELHFIDGKWYIYFAAGAAEKIWDIRIYVLENTSANPLEGQWIERGQLKTNWESFALDATTFTHRGMRYLAWAQKDPAIEGNTNLYLAKMDSPVSITGKQVMLSKPELPWEKVRYAVNEGPAFIARNGRVFLTYSAAGTGAEYCLGLLTADENADLLDPAAWKKSPEPVFKSSDTRGIYGPGHNSFTTSADRKTDLLVYHARDYAEIKGNPLKDPNRHTRVQAITWHADGTPDFGEPAERRAPPPPKFGPVKRTELRARDASIWPNPATQTYHMYFSVGQRGPNGRAAVVSYTSKDLEIWTGPKVVFEVPENFWADRGIWAPEIHVHQGKYYLFVTFDSSHLLAEQWRDWLPRVKRGSQVLVSDSPDGPFKPFANESTVPADMMTLDGTLWVEDGVPYMVYAHEWVQIKDGTMEMIRLKEDLSATIGEPTRLFHGSDAPWALKSADRGATVTDGPWLHRMKNGTLLMLWSSFGTGKYTVGIARSQSGKLAGPWIQQAEPLFAQHGGHPMLFTRFDGQLMLALHLPNRPPEEREHFFEVDEVNDTLILKKP